LRTPATCTGLLAAWVAPIEGSGHLDVREVNAGAVGLHADLHVGVDDALDRDGNFMERASLQGSA
jgi:hypothetical protein